MCLNIILLPSKFQENQLKYARVITIFSKYVKRKRRKIAEEKYKNIYKMNFEGMYLHDGWVNSF